jgi:hypothetical protein
MLTNRTIGCHKKINHTLTQLFDRQGRTHSGRARARSRLNSFRQVSYMALNPAPDPTPPGTTAAQLFFGQKK